MYEVFRVDGVKNNSNVSETLSVAVQPELSGEVVSVENPLPTRMGVGDLTVSAWGEPVFVQPTSLFHGVWTFDIPPTMWNVELDGTEITATTEADNNGAYSKGGALEMDTSDANVVSTVLVHSRRHPRYQPNRGHKYSTAVIVPDAANDGTVDFGLFNDENGIFFRVGTDGLLYAVRKSGGVEVAEELIDTSVISGFDLTKGNVYDIQYQWRGVGNYKFFINLTLVHTMNLLGALSVLSIENPALPASFKVTKGATQNVSLIVGCVDITSEGGKTGREQYGSAIGSQGGNNIDYPIVSIYNPPTINSKPNTRDLKLARVTASSDGKVTVKVWKTRTLVALTGESFAAIGNGSYVQIDTTATAMVTANAALVTQFKVEANSAMVIDNPSRETIDFYVTHGDIIIVSYTGNANVDAVIEFGEEI